MGEIEAGSPLPADGIENRGRHSWEKSEILPYEMPGTRRESENEAQGFQVHERSSTLSAHHPYLQGREQV